MHRIRLQGERQLQGKFWSQLVDMLMMEIGIIGILEVQGEKALRPWREVDVGLRMQIVFHVISVQIIVEIVVVLVLLDPHWVHGVG